MQDLLKIYRTLLDTTDLLDSLRDEGLHRDTLKLVDYESARLSQHVFHIEKLAYARIVALVCTHGADLVIEQADLVDAIREGERDADLNLTMADEITMLVETFGSDCVCMWADGAEQELNRAEVTQ
jgi:hypothetical protein